ncbi:MAG TPA: ABC transporter permease subunit [Verrucomicrobiae bacterium]|jgi:ABC-2 type transport system permease protein
MNVFLTLLRRELASFFLSLSGYVIIAAITLLIGLSFVVLITGIAGQPFTAPVTEMFYSTFYFWLILLLASPVITMRLFALERASGTFETLMTTLVSDLQVVTAKFAAAIIFYLVAWLPLLGCLFIVQHFTDQGGTLDAGTVGGMYLGIFLIGCVFLSLGCLASAISQSQMTAAMISFVLGVSLFSLAYLAKAVPDSAHWQSQVLACFDLFDQMHDFARGAVDTRAVIFYLSATFLFLFLTVRVVESRRWK